MIRPICVPCAAPAIKVAKNLTAETPSYVWLLSQVRRAKEDDQREILDWLRKKFGET